MPGLLFPVVCQPVAEPHNGSVTLSGFGTGDTAVYSCDEGFGLVGQSTRFCMDDSTWCGEAPVCRSELTSYFIAHTMILVFYSSLPYITIYPRFGLSIISVRKQKV